MKCWLNRMLLVLLCVVALPYRSPAPLIYRPGEGWSYEPVGGGGTKWQRGRAKDQLDVAQAAFDKKDYSQALRAARRVVRVWPLSDYAPTAQYLIARCYEAKGQDEKAFKEYQKVLEKQPKIATFQDILQRQFEIANKFLGGKWFKLWGFIPIFSSMDKTADMFEKIVRTGPYSDVAPQAQMKIGAAREKQKNFALAAKAYETAADRYHDRPQIAADALFRQGMSYDEEAQTAEYDQSTAGQAIATFTDFSTLFPGDARVMEAQKLITSLRSEQARGNFMIAKFYEKYKKWNGALVYYNEVLLLDPNSSYATLARLRIDELKKAKLPKAASK
ncbi:MAG TPA: outer membrane protein assembly factor BamD [Verrucomicrobiae bacterium]|nr:outer membrane protein assembly factor BamD [Verrucomicrobiae bacterium]